MDAHAFPLVAATHKVRRHGICRGVGDLLRDGVVGAEIVRGEHPVSVEGRVLDEESQHLYRRAIASPLELLERCTGSA
jgi:hypothetical protein